MLAALGKRGGMTGGLALSVFWLCECYAIITDAASGARREAEGAGGCAAQLAAPITVQVVRGPSTPQATAARSHTPLLPPF